MIKTLITYGKNSLVLQLPYKTDVIVDVLGSIGILCSDKEIPICKKKCDIKVTLMSNSVIYNKIISIITKDNNLYEVNEAMKKIKAIAENDKIDLSDFENDIIYGMFSTLEEFKQQLDVIKRCQSEIKKKPKKSTRLAMLPKGKKYHLYVDMDGVLAEWNIDLKDGAELYKEGYFYNLKPQKNVIAAFKELQKEESVVIHVLSAVLRDSKFAKKEKNFWLDFYLKGVDRRFVYCDESKMDAIKNLNEFSFLFDDYNINLNDWNNSHKTAPNTAVKMLNGINSKKSWSGPCVDIRPDKTVEEIKLAIMKILNDASTISSTM